MNDRGASRAHGGAPCGPRWHAPGHWRGPQQWRAHRDYWKMRGHLHRAIFVWFGVSMLLAGLTVAAVFTFFHSAEQPRWVLVIFAGAALWGASGFVARRLMRPLRQVVRVARDIGEGRLDSRVQLGRPHRGEVAVLGDAINDMADRIEQQMADQRELLAGVSHEIRSPLARLRVLVEIGRERGVDAASLDEMEAELLEIDALVGELLASARLDFSAIETRALDARELGLRALERAGLDAALLEAPPGELHADADPTLLARALANLLDNARKHAGGARALRVSQTPDEIRFEVDDAGPGFSGADLPRIFESFVRGDPNAAFAANGRSIPPRPSLASLASLPHSGAPRVPRGAPGVVAQGASSLGLGLALVRRIARAHGGRVWAENRPEGGARVGFSIAGSARHGLGR